MVANPNPGHVNDAIPVSEGQRLFRLVPDSNVVVAKRLNIKPVTVGAWRNGHNKPARDMKELLENIYQIPFQSWTEAPSVPGPVYRYATGQPPSQGKPRESFPPTPGVQTTDFSNLPINQGVQSNLTQFGAKHTPPLPGTREGVESLIQSLRSAQNDPKCMPSDRVKLATAEARGWALLEKMDRDNEMIEDRVIRNHPMWKKIMATMLAALKPYPEATKALLDGLRALEEDEEDGN